MDSSLFQSAVDLVDADLQRSTCLVQSVVHGETPEQTVLRIREEREDLKFLLQQAAEIGQRQVQQLEETELQRDSLAEREQELSRRLSDMVIDMEEKDYRIREVLQMMEAMDARARQAEIERDEAMALDRLEPEPQGELTASGSFLTKSEGMRRVAEQNEQRTAEAEARVREKEILVVELAKELGHAKQDVDELLRKNEQEIAERRAQNVSFLQCSCYGDSCWLAWFHGAATCDCRPQANNKPWQRRPHVNGPNSFSGIEKAPSKICSARSMTSRRRRLAYRRP